MTRFAMINLQFAIQEALRGSKLQIAKWTFQIANWLRGLLMRFLKCSVVDPPKPRIAVSSFNNQFAMINLQFAIQESLQGSKLQIAKWTLQNANWLHGLLMRFLK